MRGQTKDECEKRERIISKCTIRRSQSAVFMEPGSMVFPPEFAKRVIFDVSHIQVQSHVASVTTFMVCKIVSDLGMLLKWHSVAWTRSTTDFQ